MLNFTVWAYGRKIGESRLELRPSPRRRTGAFYPTEFGLGVLPDLRAVHRNPAVEVRDPTGSPIYWESLIITDLAEMVEKAKAKRPGVVTEASATLRDSVKYVISLAIGDSLADAEPLSRRSCAIGEHPGAQRGQPAAY